MGGVVCHDIGPVIKEIYREKPFFLTLEVRQTYSEKNPSLPLKTV